MFTTSQFALLYPASGKATLVDSAILSPGWIVHNFKNDSLLRALNKCHYVNYIDNVDALWMQKVINNLDLEHAVEWLQLR